LIVKLVTSEAPNSCRQGLARHPDGPAEPLSIPGLRSLRGGWVRPALAASQGRDCLL